MPLGLNTLSVHFVPTDTATYTTPPDKTVTITVTDSGGGNPIVPSIQASLVEIGIVSGLLTVDETPGPPTNLQANLDLADSLVGLPTEVFATFEFDNEGQFIGAGWNWSTMRWEYS